MNVCVDGMNINVKITGNGDKNIVMLQGWGTGLSVYDSVAKCFNSDYRFIQFDFPGFGESDEPKEAYNVDAYADFFLKLMEALDVKSASLIGHSYGGRVIIKLATRENLGFNIEKIVLVDSAGVLPVKTFKQKIKIRTYRIFKFIFNLKPVYFLFEEVIDYWKSRQGSADYRNATPVMKKALVMAVNEDLTHLLGQIKNETLLVWGDLDTATPIRDAHIMEEKIKNSGLCVLEGTGHYSFLEKPSQFKKIMTSFFKIGATDDN